MYKRGKPVGVGQILSRLPPSYPLFTNHEEWGTESGGDVSEIESGSQAEGFPAISRGKTRSPIHYLRRIRGVQFLAPAMCTFHCAFFEEKRHA